MLVLNLCFSYYQYNLVAHFFVDITFSKDKAPVSLNLCEFTNKTEYSHKLFTKKQLKIIKR